MFGNGYGWGAFHFIGTLVGGLFAFFMVLVIAALIFLLVRFLLVATTAAKIYVAKNTPAKPVEPAAAEPAPSPSPAPAAAPAPATPVPAASSSADDATATTPLFTDAGDADTSVTERLTPAPSTAIKPVKKPRKKPDAE
ncbi:MAG: hypothetical protein ACOH10_09520 [Rhodoglobus sp.]